MKRHEKKMVDRIVSLWLKHEVKRTDLEAIIGMGPTIAGNLVDFRGELPESSAYKPEVISRKAERIRGIVFTTEERTAYRAMMSLPVDDRLLVTKWPQVRNRYNDDTGQTWRETEVALAFFETFEIYAKALELVSLKLLVAWRKFGGSEQV